MELRSWAIRILSADRLEDKLFYPDILTDFEPGAPIVWQEPTRPKGLHFQRHNHNEKLPPLSELHNVDKRAACLHRFAGHELLAVEIMAFALLAFPTAPKHFRKGLANTLREEQWHVQLYLRRLKNLNLSFEDLPHFRHFWSYTPFMTTPLRYVSLMSLTFENANLDFAPTYGAAFKKYDDAASANLMKKILEDEIKHVSFGWQWLKKTKDPHLDPWEAWIDNLPPRMTPKRAKGHLTFFPEHRHLAGLSDEWVINLEKA